MSQFEVSNTVKRFPGKYGWHYIELDEELSEDLRPMSKSLWPALLRASFSINGTKWESSIMPIKDGPLFIALPAKIRKAENIELGDSVSVTLELQV